MSVVSKPRSSKIGMAYYDLSDETLYCGEFKNLDDINICFDLNQHKLIFGTKKFSNLVKYRLMPLAITTFAKKFDNLYQQLQFNETNENVLFNVMTMPRSLFSVNNAKSELRKMEVRDFPYKTRNEIETNLAHRSLLDFEKIEMVSAVGGLLAYLFNHRIFNQLEDEQEIVSIKSIRYVKGLLFEKINCYKLLL
ncbi:chiasma assembly [Bonamia ostreae]|uniref:Chiasma assembly n=1 Tax=Bonamia ostreae TaxID=126728 RepID=A0ABV2AJV7_9EUKA